MILGEQEISCGFLNKIKRVKNKPHKQSTLNRAKMLEHHIQHRTKCQDVGTTYPTSYMSICFNKNEANTSNSQQSPPLANFWLKQTDAIKTR